MVAQAFPLICEASPGVRLLVAGRGDADEARALFGERADRVEFLGGVSDRDKAALLSSVDIYLAPNTGGESFGIILVEAMSAGSYIVASDIPAFRAVLGNGSFGGLFANADAQDLAETVVRSLADPRGRSETVARAQSESRRYDWSTVASQIYAVYETAVRTAGLEVEE